MGLLGFLLIAAAVLGLAVLLTSFICFRMGFFSPPRVPQEDGQIDLPEGEIYEPYWDSMRRWAEEAEAMHPETFSVTSFDGLKLYGKFYEYAPGAPIELMFHGYRGSAERDLSGGVQRCFKLGRSALIVDQRGGGRSEGSVITFGINERRDCLTWLEMMGKHFGPEQKIILTGISMGAATVLMAAGEALPPNVIGVLADCGFHSPKAIIKTVIRQMGLPDDLLYPFVKLGARIFGHFDLEESSPEEAVKNCRVPVIFYHGEADDYVPWEMSRICYEACPTRKRLVTVPGAGHGLSYPVDMEGYVAAAREFFGPEASYGGAME